VAVSVGARLTWSERGFDFGCFRLQGEDLRNNLLALYLGKSQPSQLEDAVVTHQLKIVMHGPGGK